MGGLVLGEQLVRVGGVTEVDHEMRELNQYGGLVISCDTLKTS
jgi:hypothetical protein